MQLCLGCSRSTVPQPRWADRHRYPALTRSSRPQRFLGAKVCAERRSVSKQQDRSEETSSAVTLSPAGLLGSLPSTIRSSLVNEFDARIFALLIPALGSVFLDPLMAVIDTGELCILHTVNMFHHSVVVLMKWLMPCLSHAHSMKRRCDDKEWLLRIAAAELA